MTRRELQRLSALRLKEAYVLLSAGCPEGAYYLAGYAAECAFKACIARKTLRHEFPDLDRARESWTHSLPQLARSADLELELNQSDKSSSPLHANWRLVREWKEGSRYERRTLKEAQGLIDALADRKYGIVSWLKRYW